MFHSRLYQILNYNVESQQIIEHSRRHKPIAISQRMSTAHTRTKRTHFADPNTPYIINIINVIQKNIENLFENFSKFFVQVHNVAFSFELMQVVGLPEQKSTTRRYRDYGLEVNVTRALQLVYQISKCGLNILRHRHCCHGRCSTNYYFYHNNKRNAEISNRTSRFLSYLVKKKYRCPMQS